MSGPPPPSTGHHAVGSTAVSASASNTAQHISDSVLMMQGLKLNGPMVSGSNSAPSNSNNNSSTATNGGANGVVVNNGEPKFYHYCYVCNTQLNSCKQALLHCSGKRHRKKLQFLQSRKHAVGTSPLAGGSPIGAAPPVGPPASAEPSPAGLNFPAHHLVAHGHGGAHRQQQHHITAMQQHQQQPQPTFHGAHHHPAQHHFEMHPHGLSAAPHHAYFHPPHHHQHPTMLSPAAVAGTDQWLHAAPGPPHFMLQQPMPHHPLALYGGGQQHPPPMLPPHMQHLAFAPMPYHGALIDGYSSSSSSPINLTTVHNDGTASSGYSGSRSAVISPSETSSMSSDPSSESRSAAGYKCHTCGRRFATGALLHNHLQTAKHYKHHAHHFHHSATSTAATGAQGSLDGSNKGDGSETDSTSTSSIYYCSLCSIAVNSHAQMQSHHAGIKHRQRANGQTQKRNSRSSSTSSEPPGTTSSSTITGSGVVMEEYGEIVVESGYTSGSGDEVLLRVGGLEADGTGPSYKCQLCSVHMNSEAQAKQHLNSPKHMLRASGSLRPFRRKTSNSFRKKATKSATVSGNCDKSAGGLEDDGCETTSPEGGLDDPDLRSETPSPDLGETDSTLTVRASE